MNEITDLKAYVGYPLRHGFETDKVFETYKENGEEPRIRAWMTISLADGKTVELEYGHGLMEGWRESDKTCTVALFIFEPGFLGLGVHSYHLWAEDLEGNVFLDLNGSIDVLDVAKPMADDNWTAPTWDLIPPQSAEVPTDVHVARLAVCAACPSLSEDICLECGCYMPVKTTLATAECPLQKWVR